MSDTCSLCGEKLGFFSKSLVCANEDIPLCSKCYKKLYDMDGQERGEYLLAHGNPQNAEHMRAFLDKVRADLERKAELEPPTRPCPICGGMMECKLKGFQIGADGNGGIYLLGGYQQYHVDLYACPDCGKVEFYTADFASLKKREEKKQQEVTCPTCGSIHSPLVGCPRCALDQASSGAYSRKTTLFSEQKPPWEK